MEIQDIMKALAKKGISTTMEYNKTQDLCYVDLQTMAKSHLYLYEDGTLNGRYDYQKKIDLSKSEDEIIIELCNEFNNALHGRNYCQEAWAELCRSKGIILKMYGM